MQMQDHHHLQVFSSWVTQRFAFPHQLFCTVVVICDLSDVASSSLAGRFRNRPTFPNISSVWSANLWFFFFLLNIELSCTFLNWWFCQPWLNNRPTLNSRSNNTWSWWPLLLKRRQTTNYLLLIYLLDCNNGFRNCVDSLRMSHSLVTNHSPFADNRDNPMLETAIDTTRSSPQWWSGRSTTRHDVLNLWSPICDSFVWGTQGAGNEFICTPPIGSYCLLIDTYGLCYLFRVI